MMIGHRGQIVVAIVDQRRTRVPKQRLAVI